MLYEFMHVRIPALLFLCVYSRVSMHPCILFFRDTIAHVCPCLRKQVSTRKNAYAQKSTFIRASAHSQDIFRSACVCLVSADIPQYARSEQMPAHLQAVR